MSASAFHSIIQFKFESSGRSLSKAVVIISLTLSLAVTAATLAACWRPSPSLGVMLPWGNCCSPPQPWQASWPAHFPWRYISAISCVSQNSQVDCGAWHREALGVGRGGAHTAKETLGTVTPRRPSAVYDVHNQQTPKKYLSCVHKCGNDNEL